MKPTAIRNRFQALESAEREVGQYDSTDGAVVFPHRPAPPAPFALSGADLLNMAKHKKELRQGKGTCACKNVGAGVVRTPHKPLTTHTQASKLGKGRGPECANDVDMYSADDPPVGPSAGLMVPQLGPRAGVGKQRPVQSLEQTREANFGLLGRTDGPAVQSRNIAAAAALDSAARERASRSNLQSTKPPVSAMPKRLDAAEILDPTFRKCSGPHGQVTEMRNTSFGSFGRSDGPAVRSRNLVAPAASGAAAKPKSCTIQPIVSAMPKRVNAAEIGNFTTVTARMTEQIQSGGCGSSDGIAAFAPKDMGGREATDRAKGCCRTIVLQTGRS